MFRHSTRKPTDKKPKDERQNFLLFNNFELENQVICKN